MSSLNHPNLIQTLQTCTLGHKIFIIMPLMEAGSLHSIINYKYPNGIKDEKILATIIKICLETLNYLHCKKYMHRDVKSGNILIGKDGKVKLGDFGVATKVKKEAKKKSFVGSCCWMPPEVISSEGYDFKFDIWSLGITIIEMAQGKAPFFNLNEIDVLRRIQFEEPPNLKDISKWSPELVNFIKACLVKNPLNRPTAEELLENHKTFLSKAQNENYLIETLLKGVPLVIERFGKMYSYSSPDKLRNDIKFNEKPKINWNFSSLQPINTEMREDDNCNLEDFEEDLSINTRHLELTSKNSKKFTGFITNTIEDNKSERLSINQNNVSQRKTLEIMPHSSTSNIARSSLIQKKKMNPEIQEALMKSKVFEGNINRKSLKKYESIKKCFDDEDDD